MLILEAQLLHDTVAECVQHHFAQVDVSTLLPDLTNMSDTISRELRESTRTYMRQHDWNTPAVEGQFLKQTIEPRRISVVRMVRYRTACNQTPSKLVLSEVPL
jgi:hypothetical protein